jgi:hypothetical protein
MIRIISFQKALFAGFVGAFAWEIADRLLVLAGVHVFDVVWVTGHMLACPFREYLWWPAGMVMHVSIGMIWAIFYAYFFWSTTHLPRWAQGLVFAILPALVAGFVMVPHLVSIRQYLIHQPDKTLGFFAYQIGWGGPISILLGHTIYGFLLGLLYDRPVGHPEPPRLEEAPAI